MIDLMALQSKVNEIYETLSRMPLSLDHKFYEEDLEEYRLKALELLHDVSPEDQKIIMSGSLFELPDVEDRRRVVDY